MSIRKGQTIIAGNSSGGSVETDDTTINKNSSDKIQAIGLIDKNTTTAKYDWTGTLAQYNALSSYNDNWTYFITDDYTDAITIDDKSITRNSSSQLQTVGVINGRDSSTSIKTWVGTKDQYDTITTKDSNTVYHITDDSNPFHDFLNILYPVGSIYLSTTATCPVAALIGIWEKVGADKVLQGAGSRGSVDTTINESLPSFELTNTSEMKAQGKTYAASETTLKAGNVASGVYPNSSGYGYTAEVGMGFENNTTLGYVKLRPNSSTYQDDAPVQPDAYLVNIFKRIS